LPLYPYRCTQCGHRFEKIQHFKDEPEKVCPQCGGVLERVLTAPGLQFKGAGWYVNDYAPKTSGSSAEAKPAEGTAEKKAETKSESKSESAPERKAASGSSSGAAPSASSSSSSATTSDKSAG
jgi:putative FmdB family regulatory protein